VFVVSTTGQGEPPANIIKFWKHLRKKSIPSDALNKTCSAVFGLGDSGYIKYNIMAKLLYRRLEALGSRMLMPIGLGDDQHPSGYEAALDDWLPGLWKALRERFHGQSPCIQGSPADDDMSNEIQSKYSTTYLPSKPTNATEYSSLYEEACAAAAAIERLDNFQFNQWGQPVEDRHSAKSPYFAQVTLNRRLTSEKYPERVVNLLRFDVSGAARGSIQYEPGDVLGVWPAQSQSTVQQFAARCDLNLEEWVRIRLNRPLSNVQNISSPSQDGDEIESTPPIRVGALIAGLLDVSSAVPRRAFFHVLLHHTPPGMHREALADLCSRDGRDGLY